MRGILFAMLGGLSTAVFAKPSRTRGQDVFDTFSDSLKKDHSSRPAPYDVFVQHNSLQRAGTDVYLYSKIKEMYPGQAVTASSDYQFSPLRFAAGASDRVQMRQIDDIEAMKLVYFQKPLRRRDGHGQVMDVVTFGGYTIAWEDVEMKAIIATWKEGPYTSHQWHIISDDEKIAHRFIQECTEWCTTFREAVLIFDNGYWQPDFSLYQEVQKADWKDVILDEDFKHKLQHDYRSFLKSEQIYKDLSVPWKRGLIFLGPPGNGKTISLKAIMKDVDLPLLYVKSFRSYQGDEGGIRMIFQRARAEAPCVLIMEDLDSLITNFNRAFFLNELDGLEDNDGLLLIGTTNHFDRLDPALSNRPSRFDRKYNFPNPTLDERKQYTLYWKGKLASNKDISFPKGLEDEVAERTDKFSFAYLKEAFVSALLTIAGREPGTPAQDFRKTLFEQIDALRKGLEEAPSLLSNGTSATGDGNGGRGGGGGGPMRDGPWMDMEHWELQRGGRLWNLVDEL